MSEPFGGHSPNVVVLAPESVEAVARLVVELLREAPPAPGGMVDAAGLAAALGVSRDTVYRHQEALGVVRVGGALRFDVDAARAAWTARTDSKGSQAPASPAVERSAAPGRPRLSGTRADLLPIGAEEARRARAEGRARAGE